MLTRWKPFRELERSFWGDRLFPERFFGERNWTPELEITEHKEHFLVKLDAPEVQKENLAIELKEGLVTLSGKREEEKKEEREGYYYSERRYGSFQRSFRLPEGVDSDAIEANFSEGVLTIKLPKLVPSEPEEATTTIPIQ